MEILHNIFHPSKRAASYPAILALAVLFGGQILGALGCRTKDTPAAEAIEEERLAREAKVSATQDTAGSTGDVVVAAVVSGNRGDVSVQVLEAKKEEKTGKVSDVQTVPGANTREVRIPFSSVEDARRVFGTAVAQVGSGARTANSVPKSFEVEPKSPSITVAIEFKLNTTSQPGDRMGEIRRDPSKDASNMKGVPVLVTAVFQNAAGQDIPGSAGVAAQNQNMLNTLGIGAFNTTAAKSLKVTVTGPGLPSTGRTVVIPTDVGTTTHRIFPQ